MFKIISFLKVKSPTSQSSAPNDSNQSNHQGQPNQHPNRSPHYPFTEEGIRKRAQQVYERRLEQGLEGTPEGDWKQATRELKRERSPLGRFYQWSGLGQKNGWELFTSISLPIVLFAGGSLFTSWNNQQQRRIADDNRKQDLEIADNRQKDEVLKNYIESMKGYLLDEKYPLRKSKDGDERRNIARTLTLTTLSQLNRERDKQQEDRIFYQRTNDDYSQHKALVMQFLHESKLIEKPKITKNLPIINLEDADLSGVYIFRADLSGADLSGTDLSGAYLLLADLRNADLSGTYLSGADLRNADLGDADLSGAILRNADLFGADLSGAILSGANLLLADLGNADLGDADLSGADLSGADLSGADLSGANLSDANLSGAYLPLVDLSNAKNLRDEQLTQAYLCRTKLPEGSKLNFDRDCEELIPWSR